MEGLGQNFKVFCFLNMVTDGLMVVCLSTEFWLLKIYRATVEATASDSDNIKHISMHSGPFKYNMKFITILIMIDVSQPFLDASLLKLV